MVIQTIFLSGDHAGFKIKEKIKPWLEKQGYKIKDFGPHTYKKDDDYPDFVIPMAKALAKNKQAKGIMLAGSGQGEMIAVNRIPGIRAVPYYGHNSPVKVLKLSRQDNNANILSMGARFLTEKETKKAIQIWLKEPFSNATRHKRRLKKIESYTK